MSHQPPQYNPVADFILQRGPGYPEPDEEEQKLLAVLNKHEIDALISILNKQDGIQLATPYIHGAVSF